MSIVRTEDAASVEVTVSGRVIEMELYGAEHDNYGWTKLTTSEALELINSLHLAIEASAE